MCRREQRRQDLHSLGARVSARFSRSVQFVAGKGTCPHACAMTSACMRLLPNAWPWVTQSAASSCIVCIYGQGTSVPSKDKKRTQVATRKSFQALAAEEIQERRNLLPRQLPTKQLLNFLSGCVATRPICHAAVISVLAVPSSTRLSHC